MSDLEKDLQDLSEQQRVRVETLKKITERGENPYKNGFTPTSFSSDLKEEFGEQEREALEVADIRKSVAGRVMAIRDFGKAAFLRIKDQNGLIQVYFHKATLQGEKFEKYKEIDVGDIIFVEGSLFKTKTGELSIKVLDYHLLSKSLRPLPEKYHGIADVEIKYRQRYLDLIMSDQTRETFQKRFRMIHLIRKYFAENGFIEVETPMMHPIAGGAAARPFQTHHNTLDLDLFLRIAPELYLKRLVVGGFEKVFEINRNFRNEGISIQHNPEFTMIEFYQAYATYEDLIPFTENLVLSLAKDICGSGVIDYQGTKINFEKPWQRLTVEDAIVKYSGFKDKAKLRDKDALLKYGREKGLVMNPKDPVGALMIIIFEEEVEAKLIQPTFVTQYPLDVSPLSRKNEKDPFLVDRFELFIYGREIANAFSELNDPFDQRERFEEQAKAKAAGNEEACDIDEDYLTALEYAMPPTAGQGIGIDRLAMLLTNSASIRDVILFPQLRPQVSTSSTK